jgi:hypothetical protein
MRGDHRQAAPKNIATPAKRDQGLKTAIVAAKAERCEDFNVGVYKTIP